MKQLYIFTSILLLAIITIPLQAQEDPFINDFLERWENSRDYLILIAETMPKDAYDFKAAPESLSFAENLMHIGFAIDWHTQSLLGGKEARVWQTDTIYKTANKSKAEMIGTINKTFDESIALIQKFPVTEMEDTLNYFGLNRSKRQIFLLLTDHVTHHRGQMLVSMRLNGLTPPRYVLFQ